MHASQMIRRTRLGYSNGGWCTADPFYALIGAFSYLLSRCHTLPHIPASAYALVSLHPFPRRLTPPALSLLPDELEFHLVPLGLDEGEPQLRLRQVGL